MLNKLFSYKPSFSRDSISKIRRICVFKVDFLENEIFCMKKFYSTFSIFNCVTKSPQFRTTSSDIIILCTMLIFQNSVFMREINISSLKYLSDTMFLSNRVRNLKTTHHNNNNIIRRSSDCYVSLCSRH